jgi:hypothetical protein
MYQGAQKIWETKKKKIISKGLLEQDPILTLQKFITTIWLRFYKIRFQIYLYDLIFQPMLSHNKKTWSGIQYEFLNFLTI